MGRSGGPGAAHRGLHLRAHVDKCPSLHARGRAFDFAGLTHEAGNVSCRYDEWGEDPARLREYWRLAASLSSRFTYTLTYAYNAQHHNHIHVDNGVNGYDDPVFQSSSRAQTQVVQGVLRHVFNAPVTLSGDYDTGTVDAVREVQRSAGITARLATTEGWRAFLAEAVRA
ncbi:extensin family protein [Tessaracoccus sp. HDW20]|uniref:extensin family protein n=1 Tax=Tessaracoccus coleopterorum TaxID=2714950 RepID=UPI0018D4AE50|nr:extensin family protein [Tessaracoccus coleopterorum]